MLRSRGITVKGLEALYKDNKEMIISRANPDSEFKKKHAAISYHNLRGIYVAGIINPIGIFTMVTPDDILTKLVMADTLGSF